MMEKLQIWGGIECTLNRVGDIFHDQLLKNGHQFRRSDLDLFKELGISKIRYPCLWEKVSPTNINTFDWAWLDERLSDLKKLNIDVIAGFLHHGSGPLYTNLLDPEFPEKLAYYASEFIKRYPWIEYFTPINEINTTARFSCLYGHWYPHHKSDHSFIMALMNQVKATILCMKEIRKVNPRAKLIQTDDLGEALGTNLLKEQVEFENHRRWLGWDFLIGRVNSNHPLFRYLESAKIDLKEMDWVLNNKFPPDIIGINHYPLSNRFLDENIDDYPPHLHGSNGFMNYADAGAIDTGRADIIPLKKIISDAWQRYSLPIAITEIHTRGFRESQVRWLNKVYTEVLAAREIKANVISITPWSLLGTYDWNSLCTIDQRFYEPGVFDLRTTNQRPKITAISKMIKTLSQDEDFEAPWLHSQDWVNSREIYFAKIPSQFQNKINYHQPILLTGVKGTLGTAFLKICQKRNLNVYGIDRSICDLRNIDELKRVIDQIKPWSIINAAGFVDVDNSENEPERCFDSNVKAVENLAIICQDKKLKLINFSSDLVFDGVQNTPYFENAQTNPLNTYGSSKAHAENIINKIYPQSLILRTSSFFGPWDNFNFLTSNLHKLKKNESIAIANDIIISPTYLPDLVNSSLDLLIDGEEGLFHLANQGEVSWYQFFIRMLEKFNFFDQCFHLIRPIEMHSVDLIAKRPKYSVLSSYRTSSMPELDDALKRYKNELHLK